STTRPATTDRRPARFGREGWDPWLSVPVPLGERFHGDSQRRRDLRSEDFEPVRKPRIRTFAEHLPRLGVGAVADWAAIEPTRFLFLVLVVAGPATRIEIPIAIDGTMRVPHRDEPAPVRRVAEDSIGHLQQVVRLVDGEATAEFHYTLAR